MSRRPIRIRAVRRPLDVDKYVAALIELALVLAEAQAAVDQPGAAA